MLSPAPDVLREAVHDGFPVIAIWDGKEVLMMTKRLAGTPGHCDTVGAAYQPAKDTWRTLPPFNGVGDCFDPLTWDKAVWDGNEMLIWGTTNAAFDPSTNTWRHLPPSPLQWASPAFAVWTGRQLIGWGGGGGDAVTGEGAAYTPATNSWKRLPPAPLAGSGRLTTGAWTGHEVVVTGGEAPGRRGMHFFRDAAAYDPVGNTWRRLAPMPIAESAAAAVWDGNDVILTGAEERATPGTTQPVTRDLAYDPATDRWRWIAAMQYPRGGAAIAWTDRELVVWGGTIGDHGIPPHGEAYDPNTDTWSAIPRSPLRARYAPIAVWTGTNVVVWGGQDARNWDRMHDGAAFTPASP
jgi:N-acetylneuraminic acid mutarotase